VWASWNRPVPNDPFAASDSPSAIKRCHPHRRMALLLEHFMIIFQNLLDDANRYGPTSITVSEYCDQVIPLTPDTA
jgi:hypothetical protein